MVRNIQGVGPATLVQDKGRSNRFVSFGPVDSIEAVENWRARPEIKERQARSAEVTEGLERGVCDVRA